MISLVSILAPTFSLVSITCNISDVNNCANLYYNSGNSPITDREYDELLLRVEGK